MHMSPAKSRPKSSPATPKTKLPARPRRQAAARGPERGRSPATEAAQVKADGTEALASAFPFNAAKPTEYEDAARDPVAGQAAAPPHPSVTGSTLSETTASPKLGSGAPPDGVNPNNAPLERVRVDSGGRVLTTNQGVPVADN
jgi:catalase